MRNLELLVHISAPTSYKDDELYRRLAKSADDFEATTKINCTALDGDGSLEVITPCGEKDGVQQQDGHSDLDCWSFKTGKPQKSAICVTATQSNQVKPGDDALQRSTPSAEIRGKTPICYEVAPDFGSFTSTLKTPTQQIDEIQRRWSKQQPSSKKRPALRLSQKTLEEASTKGGTPHFLEDTQEALAALVDYVPSSDSALPNSISGGHYESQSRKRRRLSVDHAATQVSGKSEAFVIQSSPALPAVEPAVANTRIPFEHPETHGPNSQLRDSYDLSNSHSQSSSKGQGSWLEAGMGPSLSFELPFHGSQQSQVHTDEDGDNQTDEIATTNDHPPNGLELSVDGTKLQENLGSSYTLPRTLYAQSYGAHANRSFATAAPQNDHATVDFGFGSLPIELEPPPPPTAKRKTFNESTPTLESFSRSLSPDRYFKTSFISRPIQDDERGCWIIETNSWGLKYQYEFWTQLKSLITTGRLGAVRCQRNTPQHYPWTGTDGKEKEGLGTVWVFCWGQVVSHLWLTMLIHSHREIEKSRACWTIGSPENLEVVVQMP
ncbi:hypothetical protein IWX49DRAFT_564689 [Phyllosticta citricarpa]|uniref:Uncharacterized protein n=1 Tax=Phyllosticta citricarpa TaxID=55181 RepID=A0ABR1MJV5_9PEZI